MKDKILKAINKGINNALILFDDHAGFNKSSKIDRSLESTLLANGIVDICLKNNSITDAQYNQIINDAYYQVKDKKQLDLLIIFFCKYIGNECNLNWIDTSQITDMSYLFKYNSEFNGNITKWDTSNVTNMSNMFFQCHNFNQDISGWNVSKVENMYAMFEGCTIFNQDLSRWDVDNCGFHIYIFNLCNIEEKNKPKFIGTY